MISLLILALKHTARGVFVREELKQEFYAKFDEVDQILAAKTKELHQATASKEAAAEALNRANILLEQLEAVKKELEDILEI